MTHFHVVALLARVRKLAGLGLSLFFVTCVCLEADSAPPPDYKPVVDSPIGRRVFADLAAYYSACDARKHEPDLIPYKEMATRLSSKELADRKEAGEYLYALCLQTEADDRNGRTPRPHGMKLGGGPNYYGAELRGWMANAISDATFDGNGKEAFEVARWLYKHETWPAHREDGVHALTRIRTPDADKLFVEMIQKSEGHFGILTAALQQAAERNLVVTTNLVRPLCRHYNPDVRDAALALATKLGLKDVARYDPRTDLGERIELWLKTVLTVLPDKVPAGSKWSRFTIPNVGYDFADSEEPKTVEVCGWLVGENDGVFQVIDWMGQPQSWSRKEAQLRPDSLSEFSQRMVKIREAFNASEGFEAKEKLQESLGIRVFMMSSHSRWEGSIPEVLVAAWSLERGDRETCARLMIPLMADVSDERLFLDHLRDELAVEIDERMLAAFTARDFDEALRIAKLLAKPWFDGFAHQDRAKGLAGTLPRRSEDFKQLSLVPPQTWAKLKKEYSRQQQIEYLAKRLRLIHATQGGIPGGIQYSDTQYLVEEAAKGEKKRMDPAVPLEDKEAINPYSELLRLNLTGAEMLTLVPYLESPDYILAFDLYRFIPNNPYQVHKVSWVVASLFNTISQEDLVDSEVLEGQEAIPRKQHLDEIRKWCSEHAAVTHSDHLAKAVTDAKEWQDARSAFWELLELDENRAIKLIVSRCDSEATRKPELAKLLCLLDRKEYLPRAREWIQDKDKETRFWGALWTLKHADPKNPQGLEIVLERLAAAIEGHGNQGGGDPFVSDPASLVEGAVEALVTFDDPRVRKFFSTYCGSKPYRDFHPSSETLQRLFLAGYESAHDRLLYHLGDNTPEYKGSKRPSSDAWLWWLSNWRYKNPPDFLYNLPDEKRAEAYADLKLWLGVQFRLIKDGKPTDIIKDKLNLPWGEWKMYSSGWVRRI